MVGLTRLKDFAAGVHRDRNWYLTRVGGMAATTVIRAYRPLLRGCTFIAVTGSCGKTTTKELIAGALGTRWQGSRSPDNLNQHYHLAMSLLRTRLSDRFSVQEVAIGKFRSGLIDLALELVRPTIGVVTNIGSDHIDAFGSLDAIAREKRKVVEALPPSGTAVLNADDPRVLAMREHCRAKVLTYGTSQEAAVRAIDVSAAWPERLSFTVVHGDRQERVQTQLCGEHWLSAALAAVAVSLTMGMSLAESARALRGVPPFPHRMFPVERPDGVTFIMDDYKSPCWTLPATFAFVRGARARRRVIVVGTLSDHPGSSRKAYRMACKAALESADQVVFVGTRASKALPVRSAGGTDTLQVFYALDDACRHLGQTLAPGDLVLLKGGETDALHRICAATPPPPGNAAEPGRESSTAASESRPADAASTGWTQAVVGFGNHGDRYRLSPHNLSHEVLEILARFFDVAWTAQPEAWIATVAFATGTVHLVKPRTNVNDSGGALKRVAARLGFGAGDCILVHDDLAFEPGVVRSRLRGNDGGHQGVHSVLTAFGSIDVRRVKLGVGYPAPGASVETYVLTPMSPDRLAIMRPAFTDAAHHVLTQLAMPRAARAEVFEARARFERDFGAPGGATHVEGRPASARGRGRANRPRRADAPREAES